MDPSKIEDKSDLATVPSQDLNHDDVFGELREDGPNYRNVGRHLAIDNASKQEQD